MHASVRWTALALCAAAALFATLGAPAAAEASIYIWKNVDGSWTEPTNWQPVDGGTTYPNNPGDQALFSADYTAFRTVTIPDGAVVTVGKIFFTDRAMTITSVGSGRLRLDNGADAPEITRVAVPIGDGDVIGAPVELRGNAVITVSAAAAHILFSSEIGNADCACGITKKAPGKLYLRGDNSYVGLTRVEGGLLILDQSNSPVIKGDLEIGSGTPGPGFAAEVLIAKADQIFDNSRVLVTHQGLLTVDAAEIVGETTINEGFINIRTGAGLFAPKGLNMTGGIIDSRTNGVLRLDGDVTAIASGNGNGPARITRSSGNGALDLGPAGDRFTVNDTPNLAPDMTIDLPIIAAGNVGLVKTGAGTLRFRGGNTYPGATQVLAGKLTLEPPAGARSIVGPLSIGSGPSLAIVDVVGVDALADNRSVLVGQTGVLWINTSAPESIGPLTVTKGGAAMVGNLSVGAKLITPSLSMEGGSVQMFFGNNTLEVTTTLNATSKDQETAEISDGQLVLGGARTIFVLNRPAAIDLRITSQIAGGPADGLVKTGEGVALLSGANTYGGVTRIAEGTLLINGSQSASPITLAGGTLGGSGRTGAITAGTGRVAPGESPGRLRSGSVALTSTTEFAVEVNGTAPGTYDQLAVTGTVNLGGAMLRVIMPDGTAVPRDASWTIVDNDGTDPIVGTFDGMPEGYQFSERLRITYRGGDGNDAAIEAVAPPTYYLAEGATGEFFDDDVLIANPNELEAPVTLTFLTERSSSATVVVQRVVPARSRVTVHVEEIEGLENASASVTVESTGYLPLVVERTMFWDASYYGGHTANAVTKPETQWIFAEGFQGFFDTYLLIANANAAPITATLTFLRENDTPVVKTVEVAAFQRKTVYAGDFDELKERAFGVVVDATGPVIAERAMYFATQPGKLWAGGHVNTGIVAPSRSWFHAEGATGSYFSTFILLSNPQTTQANVEVKFLLADGTVITRPKTLAPQQRVTINPAAEGDSRLENAALSTVVQSDVPIVSERSMYWEGDAKPLGEGHNSSGVTETGLRWGLAEGRIGGDRVFDTYILLANPSTTMSRVRVTFLRESGAPIVKLYDVAATSRFNIDVKTEVPELLNSSFGADIEVLNDVPIAVERSLYWNANGAFWAGGSNALATPLQPRE